MRLIVRAVLAVTSFASLAAGQSCPQNEIWRECGNHCKPTCSNPYPICIAACADPGCFCDTGYLRVTDAAGSPCVPPQNCPSETSSATTATACSTYEEYSECGSACELDCTNYDQQIFCPAECIPGCFCPKGMIRDVPGGDCITSDECLVEPTTAAPCDANEEYKRCGTACEPNCIDDTITFGCVEKCVEGCFCVDGMIRDVPGGECIPPDECPVEPEPATTCSANEEYSTCGTMCEPTCGKMPEPCVKVCAEPGCFCNFGYLRETDAAGSPCVLPENCPSESGPDSDSSSDLNEACKGCSECLSKGKKMNECNHLARENGFRTCAQIACQEGLGCVEATDIYNYVPCM